MKIIKYIDSVDNDELNKPQTGNASVYAVESTHANKTYASITKETLIEQYAEVFSEEVGKLAGEYHIRIDSSIDPVQHVPRRVPVALTTKVKEALEDLEKQEIVTTRDLAHSLDNLHGNCTQEKRQITVYVSTKET